MTESTVSPTPLDPNHVDTSNLNALGSNTTYTQYENPTPDMLESFDSPFNDPQQGRKLSTIRIEAPEFTSLCPKTGQPDFATIIVDYIPDKRCVESKSFKMYLMAFRNQGEFHEACVNRIVNDLVAALDPIWLRVKGEFTPRGGIPFHPTVTYSRTDRDNKILRSVGDKSPRTC